MWFSLSLLAGWMLHLTLITAAPTTQVKSAKNFYLVTTSQSAQGRNSSALPDVSAISLFDPFDQKPFLLRLISPGYGSVPRFNLTDGTLHTISSGIEGSGTFEYNSTVISKGGPLEFLPENEKRGSLHLKEGYLLSVQGHSQGWTICPGPIGDDVISWRGNATNCKPTYIQAVQKAPY